MDLRLKVILTIAALASLALTVLLYESELFRRIYDYFFIYIIVWAASITVLTFFGFGLVGKPNILKLFLVSMGIAYFSSVLAYFTAILMDISNIRSVHKALIWEAALITLVYPYLALRAWSFGLILFVVSTCIHYFSPDKNK